MDIGKSKLAEPCRSGDFRNRCLRQPDSKRLALPAGRGRRRAPLQLAEPSGSKLPHSKGAAAKKGLTIVVYGYRLELGGYADGSDLRGLGAGGLRGVLAAHTDRNALGKGFQGLR
jgi:hypothetical protein